MRYLIVRKDGTPLNTFTPDVQDYKNPLQFSPKNFSLYPTREKALKVLRDIQTTMNRGTYSTRSMKVLQTLAIKEVTE